MNKKFFVSSVLLASLLFGQILPVLACGPFTDSALFSYTRHADLPLGNYTAGKIGVVPSTYGRMSLFVFYRELAGKPLTAFEQKEVELALQSRISGMSREALESEAAGKPVDPEESEPLKAWLAARQSLGAGPAQVTQDFYDKSNYSSYENCLDDAFRTALNTFESRRGQYGAGEDLSNWLGGQDAVFSNCSGKDGTLPGPAPQTAPDWLKRDRKYQLAAANFYRRDFTAARSLFAEVSDDKDSPWWQTAKFMLARTDTREADSIDIGHDYHPERTPENAVNWDKRIEIYRHAAEELRAIISDPAMEYYQASAHRLLRRAAYRTSPDERLRELAAALSGAAEDRFIYSDLKDLISLLDDAQVVADDVSFRKESDKHKAAGDYDYTGGDRSLQIDDYAENVKTSDLSDWLITYQATGEKAFEHACERWKETGARQWLVSAISKAEKSSPGVDEMIKAADAIAPGSAGFANAKYHVVRLLIQKGDRLTAKQKLREVNIAELPLSSRNNFLGLKAALAANLSEYLKYAKREPIGLFGNYDANESGSLDGLEEAPDDQAEPLDSKKLAQKVWFDEDAVAFFSEKAPLSVVAEAANSPETPPNLKKFFLSMAWARAMILNRGALAQSYARRLKQYAPEYGPSLSKYIAAGDPTERDAAGLIAILRYPLIDANLPLGVGREESSPISFDSNRGNWWCFEQEGQERKDAYDSRYGEYQFSYPGFYPAFLSPQNVKENESERKQLLGSGQSATFLNRRAVEFANAHPNHPDTPEILHLAVRASRFGCTDEQTVKYSKQAFQILHRRFPNNYWTQKTPYYFG